ncbi:MAG: alanine dehydrogenase [Pseudazoarcus pumilus]|nr:alanine dehydrogenase [Pseudazoarcus pumilus]
MRVGIPREIKNHEYRVGLAPAGVHELVAHGHEVIVEAGAGLGIGADDDAYVAAGATIADTAQEVFERAELIVKVKEPQAQERAWLRAGQLLFTYLHLAPDPAQTRDLLARRVTALAYETVTGPGGTLPLLAPMSEIAGRMSIQAGAHCLEKAAGGRGVLLGGAAGVEPGHVVVLGAGMVGLNATDVALGMGARVTVIDRSMDALRRIAERFDHRAATLHSSREAIARALVRADLVIGGVLVPGGSAPKLVTREMIAGMAPGSVIVDVAIDQGGCCETSRATTHDDPTYVEHGIIHYCVANMPGAVARTATQALNAATLPHIVALANKGWRRACAEDRHLAAGLNVHDGHVTHTEVAHALGLPARAPG